MPCGKAFTELFAVERRARRCRLSENCCWIDSKLDENACVSSGTRKPCMRRSRSHMGSCLFSAQLFTFFTRTRSRSPTRSMRVRSNCWARQARPGPTSIGCATRLQSQAPHVRVVYEAGPCGYGLYRQLVQKGFDCMVCAPSLIPRKPRRTREDRPARCHQAGALAARRRPVSRVCARHRGRGSGISPARGRLPARICGTHGSG